jgi:hypothetical protein
MPKAFCNAAYFGAEPWLLTAPQIRTLPGGEYIIGRELINLPAAPRSLPHRGPRTNVDE